MPGSPTVTDPRDGLTGPELRIFPRRQPRTRCAATPSPLTPPPHSGGQLLPLSWGAMRLASVPISPDRGMPAGADEQCYTTRVERLWRMGELRWRRYEGAKQEPLFNEGSCIGLSIEHGQTKQPRRRVADDQCLPGGAEPGMKRRCYFSTEQLRLPKSMRAGHQLSSPVARSITPAQAQSGPPAMAQMTSAMPITMRAIFSMLPMFFCTMGCLFTWW